MSGDSAEETAGYVKGMYCHVSHLSSSRVLLSSQVDSASIDSSSEVLKDTKKSTGSYYRTV